MTGAPSPRETEGAGLIGAMLSYPMYGTLICQVIWYFKHFPDDLKRLKILRGIGIDPHIFLYCDNWTINAFFIPNEATCFLAEGLFLQRMWTLSKRRYPTILALVPFTLGWVFTVIYIHGMFQHPCFPKMKLNRPYLFASYGFRFCSDGIIAATMCSLLYQQTSDMPIRNRPNFVRIVNSLVLWTVSTGLLMWFSAIAFVLTYILLPQTFVALAIYFVRGNIYANAVLALLHARTRYRRVADEMISLHVDVASGPTGAREDRGL